MIFNQVEEDMLAERIFVCQCLQLAVLVLVALGAVGTVF